MRSRWSGGYEPGEEVDVLADGAHEQDGLLGDDGDARAQVHEADLADVDVVDEDAALARVDDAQQRDEQRRLARACAAHDPNLLLGPDAQAHALEHGHAQLLVLEHDLVEDDAAALGPAGRRPVALDDARRLLLHLVAVVRHLLHRG